MSETYILIFYFMTCWYTFPRKCPLPTLQYIGRFTVQENIFIPLYFNSYFSNISFTARLYLYRFWAFLISFAHLCESSKLSDIYVHISFILNSKCLSAFIIFSKSLYKEKGRNQENFLNICPFPETSIPIFLHHLKVFRKILSLLYLGLPP